MSKGNKISCMWETIFAKNQVLSEIKEKGFYVITAKEIKKYFEPRLMAKFDHRLNLPKIFQDYDLSILPISRSSYVISDFSAYATLVPPNGQVIKCDYDKNIQSLQPQYIVNEAMALNFAYHHGILADFLNEGSLIPTVSGRMSSASFAFFVDTKKGRQLINVDKSQMEIDASYEGRNSLSLIEAKRDLASDFLIRQLYYPFRVWKDRMTKNVRPIYMVFSNGYFHLYEYCFADPTSYSSLNLIRQQSYVIYEEITMNEITEILSNIQLVQKPELSFPQADSLDRVINLVELLAENPMTVKDISTKYEFTRRQGLYYARAGVYLGLIEKKCDADNNTIYELSQSGKKWIQKSYKERQLEIIQLILNHSVFNKTFKKYLVDGVKPSKSDIVCIMKDCDLSDIDADSTYERRASTVGSWIDWILKKVNKSE